MRSLLQARLAELEASGLRREASGRAREQALAAASALGLPFLDAASNDYLGLGSQPLPVATPAPAGASASRLVHGTHPEHVELEQELAAWTRQPGALLFSSGYAANVGTLAALAREGDLIVSDALNHASIVDGCRLSRAKVRIFPHLDAEAAEAALSAPCSGQKWLVVESYYSMDGDCPPLPTLRETANRAGAALIVDEAHALGVWGPEGAGRCALQGVEADVVVGGLGKAVGTQGGFVSGAGPLRDWLWNRARPFVYSTGTSPLLAAITLARVQQARSGDGARRRLEALGTQLRAALVDLSDARVLPGSQGPIVPVVVGDAGRSRRVMDGLLNAGILAQAILPPTVPEGSSRLRISLKATWDEQAIERLAGALRVACAGS